MGRDIFRVMFDCIPEIDFNIGFRYFLGNMENYKKGLLSLLKSIKAKLPLLLSMLGTGEYEGLRVITRTLRIMMNNVGACDLSEASVQIEETLLNQEYGKLLEELTAYVNCLYQFLGNLELLLKELDMDDSELNRRRDRSFLNRDFSKTKESIRSSGNLLERRII